MIKRNEFMHLPEIGAPTIGTLPLLFPFETSLRANKDVGSTPRWQELSTSCFVSSALTTSKNRGRFCVRHSCGIGVKCCPRPIYPKGRAQILEKGSCARHVEQLRTSQAHDPSRRSFLLSMVQCSFLRPGYQVQDPSPALASNFQFVYFRWVDDCSGLHDHRPSSSYHRAPKSIRNRKTTKRTSYCPI